MNFWIRCDKILYIYIYIHMKWALYVVYIYRQHMYTMVQAVHVLVVQLILSPLISLPPKAKLGKVTISMAILTVIPHLSLGWLLAHSFVGMVHSLWLLGFRKRILKDIG